MIATLILLLSATCVTAAEMTSAEMACCAAMEHDCGAAAKEQGCCSSTPQDNAGSIAKRVSIPAPHATVVQIMSTNVTFERPARAYATTIDDMAPSPPGTSTYLLISTFRI